MWPFSRPQPPSSTYAPLQFGQRRWDRVICTITDGVLRWVAKTWKPGQEGWIRVPLDGLELTLTDLWGSRITPAIVRSLKARDLVHAGQVSELFGGDLSREYLVLSPIWVARLKRMVD